MVTHLTELLPAELANLDARIKRLRDFWKQVEMSEELGGTDWGGLKEKRAKIVVLLESGKPGDLRQAERLTTRALAHFLDGNS